jgi:hypothetical protein
MIHPMSPVDGGDRDRSVVRVAGAVRQCAPAALWWVHLGGPEASPLGVAKAGFRAGLDEQV